MFPTHSASSAQDSDPDVKGALDGCSHQAPILIRTIQVPNERHRLARRQLFFARELRHKIAVARRGKPPAIAADIYSGRLSVRVAQLLYE